MRTRTKSHRSSSPSRRYPAEVLTEDEVRCLLRACSPKAATGIRNRAVIAALYRGGLRIGEALALAPKRPRRCGWYGPDSPWQGGPLADRRSRPGRVRPPRTLAGHSQGPRDQPPSPCLLHAQGRTDEGRLLPCALPAPRPQGGDRKARAYPRLPTHPCDGART